MFKKHYEAYYKILLKFIKENLNNWRVLLYSLKVELGNITMSILLK